MPILMPDFPIINNNIYIIINNKIFSKMDGLKTNCLSVYCVIKDYRHSKQINSLFLKSIT